MRVVIVGGGVMGCASALELAARGVREVILLERSVPGAEASSAAGGILGAQVEPKDTRELDAFVAAREAYPAWVDDLRERTQLDVGFRRSGVVSLAQDDEQLAALASTVLAHRARGLDAELLEGRDRVAEVEPEIGPCVGAAFFPRDGQVDPPRLLRALVAACDSAGVVTKTGTTVSRVVEREGRCVGVELDGRERLEADVIVLAAGSWSSLVPGVPTDVPRVRPVRGQMVELEQRPPRLRRIVFGGHVYLVPRGDGRVVIGSTMEEVGHRREITAGGVHTLLSGAIASAPALRAAELTRTWCNFRPCSESGAELVGASSLPGLVLATGHHRNGILLARATSLAVAEAVLVKRG